MSEQSDAVERAVRIAAEGNMEVLSDFGNVDTRLDAAQFVQDLYEDGWEIVPRSQRKTIDEILDGPAQVWTDEHGVKHVAPR